MLWAYLLSFCFIALLLVITCTVFSVTLCCLMCDLRSEGCSCFVLFCFVFTTCMSVLVIISIGNITVRTFISEIWEHGDITKKSLET